MPILPLVIGRGTTAAKPAAASVPVGSLYFDTTDVKLQRSTGAAWEDCAETTAGSVATDSIWDAKGDLAVGTGANTASKLTVGADGSRLVAASGEATGAKWQAFTGARYNSNSAQNVVNNTAVAIINFEDQVYDPDSLVTTGANWKFTAPVTGYYHVDTLVLFANNTGWANGERGLLQLFKDGVALADLDRQDNYSGGGPSQAMLLKGSITIDLAATHYIDLRVAQNSGGDIALSNDPQAVWVNIERVA